MKDVEEILATEDLDDDTRSAIKGQIRKQPGSPYVKTKMLAQGSKEED